MEHPRTDENSPTVRNPRSVLVFRRASVYGSLVVVWLAVLVWQGAEHGRGREVARAALLNRARDISTTLGVVIRSQRRMGGIIPQSRLEVALQELVESDELLSVLLLNSNGDTVTSAGDPIDFDVNDLPPDDGRWEGETVTFVNLVDLGQDAQSGDPTGQPSIVLSMPDDEVRGRRERMRPPWFGRMPGGATTVVSATDSASADAELPSVTEIAADVARFRAGFRDRFRGDGPRDGASRRGRRPRFGRPPWMDEDEFQALLEKQGLHGFVLQMSTSKLKAADAFDRRLRLIIGGFALMAVIGLGLTWRNVERSAALQVRLTRIREMNAHLREMSVAAAGLAHETRNPLSIVRGLAQMISNDADTSPGIQTRSGQITEEVDRVTAQLNEFIEYSRPREARQVPVNLKTVVKDVERALESDREDKQIEFSVVGEEPIVEADEPLLRQMLFNLLLNAVQAVDRDGRVEVSLERDTTGRVSIEVQDDGPGIPEEQRESIFRPYFTTHERGTGLGLAVVHQIVTAHGWDINYIPGASEGAIFRVSGLNATARDQRNDTA